MASQELAAFIRDKKTPFYILNLNKINSNYSAFKKLFPKFKTFYSVKTNPQIDILKTVADQGSFFDAATIGEVKILKSLSINTNKVLLTHPIKTPSTVKSAIEFGVENFTFDSLEELQMLMKYAQNKKYFLRILPPAEGTFYEYIDKFGASSQDIEVILNYAVENKIDIYGMSFHVGSQTMSLEPWKATLKYCNAIFRRYYNSLPTFRIMNIGSGFPVKYKSLKSPPIEDIAEVVNTEIKEFPKGISFWVEPGRIIVADAVTLVTTITRKVQRIKNKWLFVDMGVYHGLIEILESRGKLNYPIEYFKSGKKETFSISGNTLDPDDTLAVRVSLPSDLQAGDKLIFRNVGAYTFSLYSNYHAIPKPILHIANINIL